MLELTNEPVNEGNWLISFKYCKTGSSAGYCSNPLLERRGFVVLEVVNPCKDATLVSYSTLTFSVDTP